MWPRFAIRWALAAALASPLAAPRAAAGPVQAAAAGVWLDVPFVPQRRKNACGAASLSMVMRYWEKQMGRRHSARADQQFIERQLDPHDRGIENTAMAAYLQDSGFRVFTFAGGWKDFRENLSKGRPLIVGLRPQRTKGPLHYVVVAGIDEKRNFVFVNDPAERKLVRVSRDRFAAEWRATGNWTLLAVPKEPM